MPVVFLSQPVGALDGLYKAEVIREGQWKYPGLQAGGFEVTAQDINDIVENFNSGIKGYVAPVKVPMTYEHIDSTKPPISRTRDDGVCGWARKLEAGPNEHGTMSAWGWFSAEDPSIKDDLDKGLLKFVSAEINLKWPDPEDGNKPKKVLEAIALTNKPYVKRMASIQPAFEVQPETGPVEAVTLSEPIEVFTVNLSEEAVDGCCVGCGCKHANLSDAAQRRQSEQVCLDEAYVPAEIGQLGSFDLGDGLVVTFKHAGESPDSPGAQRIEAHIDKVGGVGLIDYTVNDDKAQVKLVKVHSKARGNGIGTALYAALIDKLSQDGVKELHPDLMVMPIADRIWDRLHKLYPAAETPKDMKSPLPGMGGFVKPKHGGIRVLAPVRPKPPMAAVEQGALDLAEKLPHQLDVFFERTPTTIEVPVGKIVPRKHQPASIAEALRRMREAMAGGMAKRKPLSAKAMPDGTYDLVDGNATYGAAVESGWPTVLIDPDSVSLSDPAYRKLIHYSRNPDITEVDPEHYGESGTIPREALQSIKHIWAYLDGASREERKIASRGNRYESDPVEMDAIYDYAHDPMGFVKDANSQGLSGPAWHDYVDKRVIEAGYKGARNSEHEQYPDSVKWFGKLPVKKVQLTAGPQGVHSPSPSDGFSVDFTQGGDGSNVYLDADATLDESTPVDDAFMARLDEAASKVFMSPEEAAMSKLKDKDATGGWLAPSGRDYPSLEHEVSASMIGETKESLLEKGWVRRAGSTEYELGHVRPTPQQLAYMRDSIEYSDEPFGYDLPGNRFGSQWGDFLRHLAEMHDAPAGSNPKVNMSEMTRGEAARSMCSNMDDYRALLLAMGYDSATSGSAVRLSDDATPRGWVVADPRIVYLADTPAKQAVAEKVAMIPVQPSDWPNILKDDPRPRAGNYAIGSHPGTSDWLRKSIRGMYGDASDASKGVEFINSATLAPSYQWMGVINRKGLQPGDVDDLLRHGATEASSWGSWGFNNGLSLPESHYATDGPKFAAMATTKQRFERLVDALHRAAIRIPQAVAEMESLGISTEPGAALAALKNGDPSIDEFFASTLYNTPLIPIGKRFIDWNLVQKGLFTGQNLFQAYRSGLMKDGPEPEPFDISAMTMTPIPGANVKGMPWGPTLDVTQSDMDNIKAVVVGRQEHVVNQDGQKIPVSRAMKRDAARKLLHIANAKPKLLKQMGLTKAKAVEVIKSMSVASENMDFKLESKLNKGVPEEFQWVGQSNLAIMKESGFAADDLAGYVKEVHANGMDSHGLKLNLGRAMLALDTNIDYSDLSVYLETPIDSPNAYGKYDSGTNSLHIRNDSVILPTVAHELGHYLDRKFAKWLTPSVETQDGQVWYAFASAMGDMVRLGGLESLPEDKQKWARAFTEFAESLHDKASMANQYFSQPYEVFARFCSWFSWWADREPGVAPPPIADTGIVEPYDESDAVKFIKLLQWKSYIDASGSASV